MVTASVDDLAVRVNGALLPQYTGQRVVVAGTVVEIDESGYSVMLKASDGAMVKVTLPSPLQENVDGVVEVHGVAQASQVLCHNYVAFPEMQMEEFDAALHDEMLKTLQSGSSQWNV